jgi:DNA-binding NarL/FixJ family response regulator
VISNDIRIVIADDHPIFRHGLRQVMQTEKSIAIVGEAGDGTSALELIENHKPDIAILDIDMPKMNGLEVVRSLRGSGNDVSVIFLTMYDDEELFDEAMDLHVLGYVLKENALHDIVHAIHAVAAGRPYISPLMSHALLGRKTKGTEDELASLESLTETERKVLRLIAQGKTSKTISDLLHVSPKTIDNHRTNIAAKLGIHGTHALLKFALKHEGKI